MPRRVGPLEVEPLAVRPVVLLGEPEHLVEVRSVTAGSDTRGTGSSRAAWDQPPTWKWCTRGTGSSPVAMRPVELPASAQVLERAPPEGLGRLGHLVEVRLVTVGSDTRGTEWSGAARDWPL